MVEFERVTVSYDRKTPVLRDVSFKVFEGEMIFVIGPNGGGKSTLLKTVVGSLRPEQGRVKLFGVDVSRFRDWWMVGYLPQNAATLFEKMPLNVSELLTAAAIHRKGMEPAEAVKLVGVEDPTSLLNKRVTDLSGGMLQKTMLALALINNPKILLLDEPTVYVDQTGVGAF
ncbi:MAG: ATP-binding cassette domain-containing protein, partial [Candidatus Caldarchaeum sp.]